MAARFVRDLIGPGNASLEGVVISGTNASFVVETTRQNPVTIVKPDSNERETTKGISKIRDKERTQVTEKDKPVNNISRLAELSSAPSRAEKLLNPEKPYNQS